jgi:hypothetical protein
MVGESTKEKLQNPEWAFSLNDFAPTHELAYFFSIVVPPTLSTFFFCPLGLTSSA